MHARSTLDWSQSNNIFCTVIHEVFDAVHRGLNISSTACLEQRVVGYHIDSTHLSRCWAWKKIKTGIKLNLTEEKAIYPATTSSSKHTRLYSL